MHAAAVVPAFGHYGVEVCDTVVAAHCVRDKGTIGNAVQCG